jgi:hypothetical protein
LKGELRKANEECDRLREELRERPELREQRVYYKGEVVGKAIVCEIQEKLQRAELELKQLRDSKSKTQVFPLGGYMSCPCHGTWKVENPA